MGEVARAVAPATLSDRAAFRALCMSLSAARRRLHFCVEHEGQKDGNRGVRCDQCVYCRHRGSWRHNGVTAEPAEDSEETLLGILQQKAASADGIQARESLFAPVSEHPPLHLPTASLELGHKECTRPNASVVSSLPEGKLPRVLPFRQC